MCLVDTHNAMIDVIRFPHFNEMTSNQPIWDTHPAKLLLQDDIKNKLNNNMPPKVLHQTCPEYLEFNLPTF